MRHKPTHPRRSQKQIDFLLLCDVLEVLFGGAAGGGKSEALLMAALQFVEVPKYAAIIFRKTYKDLALPGALMDRSHELLSGMEVNGHKAHWNGQDKIWTFPSGATLSFGYLDSSADRYRYQSSEFQYIGFDELTQFEERDYKYLFSRLRRTAESEVPLRMRAGTNPGGHGHTWVKKRFDPDGKRPEVPGRCFVGSKLEDNPYIDLRTYEQSLEQLDSQTRKQYRGGDWTDFGGNHYHPDTWPRYINTGDAYRIHDGANRTRHIRHAECSRIITLDWALGKPKKDQPTEVYDEDDSLRGDCTAFVVADLSPDGLLFPVDCVNEKIPLVQNAPRLAELCRRWRPIMVAGDDDNLSYTMLLELRRYRDIPTVKCLAIGSRNKLMRSQSSIIRAERGLVYLPDYEKPWSETMCDQLAAFDGVDGKPDDIADCFSILGRLADQFNPMDNSTNYETSGEDMPQTGGGIWLQ